MKIVEGSHVQPSEGRWGMTGAKKRSSNVTECVNASEYTLTARVPLKKKLLPWSECEGKSVL